jgi:hypothetical protein
MLSRSRSSGFSQRQALPALATLRARSACVALGVTMMTASTAGSARISSTEEATLGRCGCDSLRPTEAASKAS